MVINNRSTEYYILFQDSYGIVKHKVVKGVEKEDLIKKLKKQNICNFTIIESDIPERLRVKSPK